MWYDRSIAQGTGMSHMRRAIRKLLRRNSSVAAMLFLGPLLLDATPAIAAGCAFEPQGEGRVAAVIDARTFRLDDGREVRLAGIEPAVPDRAKAPGALSAIITGRDLTLHGQDDAPDRYGRQPAFAFLAGAETPVQSELLRRGEA